MRDQVRNQKIIRIALVGAPGTGKSAVITRLRELERSFASVGYIDEVATSIFNTLPKGKFRADQHLLQAIIAQQQISLEKTLGETLLKENLHAVPPILLTDRAVFDSLIYSDCKTILNKFGLDIESLPPYDLVINLKGGGVFENNSNPWRTETSDEIAALAAKTPQVWANHTKLFQEVDFCDTIENKTFEVAKRINSFVHLPLYKESSLE